MQLPHTLVLSFLWIKLMENSNHTSNSELVLCANSKKGKYKSLAILLRLKIELKLGWMVISVGWPYVAIHPKAWLMEKNPVSNLKWLDKIDDVSYFEWNYKSNRHLVNSSKSTAEKCSFYFSCSSVSSVRVILIKWMSHIESFSEPNQANVGLILDNAHTVQFNMLCAPIKNMLYVGVVNATKGKQNDYHYKIASYRNRYE